MERFRYFVIFAALLIAFLAGGFYIASDADAATVAPPFLGGTGIGQSTGMSIGDCLKVTSITSTTIWTWGTGSCGSSSSGWATTSADYFLSQRTTTNLAEGSNLYYTPSRVQGYLDSTDKGYFFSTTSANHLLSVNTLWSTTSANFWKTQNNFFSTSSANYFIANTSTFSTTSDDYWQTQRNFFSTSSSAYWKSVTDFFSTTSADYLQTQRNYFSTSSANYFVNASTTVPKTYTANIFTGQQTFNYASTTGISGAYASTSLLFVNGLGGCSAGQYLTWSAGSFGCATDQIGGGFSTTSADYWSTQRNFFSTTSATYFLSLQSLFSTTSADYYATQRNFFSTTSADYLQTQRNYFSTSSANYFLLSTSTFSTTSANYYANASTTIPKTYSPNTFTALQTLNYASSTGISTSYASTSLLYVNGLGGCSAGQYLTWSTGSFGCAIDQVGGGFSTTSADFWSTQRNFFSTTSATYFLSLQTLFSTSSTDYYATQRNFFSTTSAIYFADSSTTIPKTYSSNTFTGLQTFNGINNLGSYVATTSYVVCLQGPPTCPFTDPETAVQALPPTGGLVHIKTGTYVLTQPLKIPSGYSQVVIEGEGEGTILRWSRFNFPTYFLAEGSAEINGVVLRDLTISQSNSAGTSVCIDASRFSNSFFYNLELRNCNSELVASTTSTFEDTFANIEIHTPADAATSAVAFYNGANDVSLNNISVVNNTVGVTGFYFDAHSIKCNGIATQSYAKYGIYVGPNASELDCQGVYQELNQTNVFVSPGVFGVNITGTLESASTTAQNFVNMSTNGVSFNGGIAFGPSNFFFGNYGFSTSSPGSATVAIQGNMFIAGNITSTSTLSNVFVNASTTALSTTYASSTSYYGAGLDAGCSGSNFLQYSTGRFGCGTPAGASSFSTTSADFWSTQRNFFSTSSATFFLGTQTLFSTTSADYWTTQRNLFSTSSADYLATQRNFFSTSSATFFLSMQSLFSTTSADYYATQRNFFSTSSAIYFADSSTTIPKTYSNNTFIGLQTFGSASTSLLSANYASSTLYFGAGLTACNGASNAITYDGNGRFGCNSIAASGGSGTATTSFAAGNGLSINTTASAITYSLSAPVTVANGGTGTTTLQNKEVLFYNSTLSTVSQTNDGFSFTWDDANKRLGIGTSSPSAPLQISTTGTGVQSLLKLTSSAASASEEPALDLGADAAGGTVKPFARISAVANSSFSTPFMKFWVDNGSGTILARAVIDKNGNFGIATTSPGSKLEVNGNAFIAGNITSTSTTASIFPNASTTAITATYASSTFYFGAGLTACNSANQAVTWNAGQFGCQTISGTGGLSSYDAWSHLSTFGTSTSATTTSIWTQGVFFSSSTKAASQFPYASSTDISTGALTISGVTGSILSTDTGGNVVATTTLGVSFLKGFVPIANGGTNNNTFTTGGMIFYDGNKLNQSASLSPFYDQSNDRLIVGDTSGNFRLSLQRGNTPGSGPFGISSTGNTNGNIFIIDTNGNVGISSTTPSGALGVQGNMFIAGNIVSTSTNTSRFPNASTTAFSAAYASSSAYYGAGLDAGCSGTSFLQYSNGLFGCGTPAGGSSFSTTSADYWSTQRNFFSTTSADYFSSQRNSFSTSSATFFLSTQTLFSTTSAIYFTDASTTIPKTYKNNTFTGLQTFANATTSLLSTTYASSTFYFGAGLTACNGGNNAITYDGNGRFGCNTITATGGGSGVGTIATSSQENANEIPFFTTKNGYPAKLSGSLDFQWDDVNKILSIATSSASDMTIDTGAGFIASSTYFAFEAGSPPVEKQFYFDNTDNNYYFSALGNPGNYALLNTGSIAGSNKTFTLPNVSGVFALGSGTTGDCAQWSNANVLTDTGAPCGSGGGLSAYDAWTHPTQTTSATTSGLIVNASSTIGDGTRIGGLTINGAATSSFAGGAGNANWFTVFNTGTQAGQEAGISLGGFQGNVFQQIVSKLNPGGATADLIFRNGKGTLSETARFTGSNGFLGLASSTPWGLLSIQPNGIAGPAFAIGSTSATYFLVNNGGNTYIGTSTDGVNPTHPGKLTIDMGTSKSENAIDAIGNNNDFLEYNCTNLSTGNNAQCGYSATADTGSLTTGFMFMGINNSKYWNPTAFNVGGPLDTNILSDSNDFFIAQGITGKKIHILNGGTSTSTNEVMTFSGNNVGVGSTTPWAALSIASSTPGYNAPILSVSTSTDATGQLFSVYATTSTQKFSGGSIAKNIFDSGVRMIIGAINQFGFPGVLDQLFVNGRINTGDWRYIECLPDSNSISTTFSADTGGICPNMAFEIDGQGALTLNPNGSNAGVDNVNVSGIHNIRIENQLSNGVGLFSSSKPTAPNVGQGLFVGSADFFVLSTSTPVMEVVGRIDLPQNSTSTRYVIGFSNLSDGGSTFETEETAGCYFVASSTLADWQAQCRTSYANTTTVDTGIASSTLVTTTGSFMRFRIEADVNGAKFYMQTPSSPMHMVANVTTNYPGTTQSMVAGVHIGTIGGGLATAFDMASFKMWYFQPALLY